MAKKELTPAEKIAEAKKEAAKKRVAEVKKQIAAGFLNPLENNVSYEEFTAELTAKKKSVKEYCKGKIEPEAIEWLEGEIENFRANKK